MSKFDEDLIIGKPFGAVFLGVQWLDGVLQQGWTEKVEHKTKSGRYLGTFQRERWENVPGVPPGGGDLERGRGGEGEKEPHKPATFWEERTANAEPAMEQIMSILAKHLPSTRREIAAVAAEWNRIRKEIEAEYPS